MKPKDLIQDKKAMKRFLNRNKITRQAKMLEVCDFLGISLNTIYEKSNALEGGTDAFGFLMKAPGLLN